MSFFYGSEKSRDFSGIDSISEFETKLKEILDRLNSLNGYERQREYVRRELDGYKNCHSIPQHMRLSTYYIALSQLSVGITGFSQKCLLNDLGLTHNSFSKWKLYPERDKILFQKPLPNIQLYRNGVKKGDMLQLLRLLLISQNADCFCDLFGGFGSVTKSTEGYFSQSYWNDRDESVYRLMCAVRDNADVGAILEEMKRSKGWRTHSYAVDGLPRLESVMMNYDFIDCFNRISEKHTASDIVWYLDPPYFCTSQYDCSFSDEQHIQLVETIKEINARRGKFVLSIKSSVTNKRLYCENPRRSSYRFGTNGSGAVIKNFAEYLQGFLPEYEFRRSGKAFELVKAPKSSRPKYQELYVYRLSGTVSDIVITNFYCPEGTTKFINGALGKKLLPTFEVQSYREYLKQIIHDFEYSQT